MVDKKKSSMTVSVNQGEVIHTGMGISKDGYNHAGITIKRGENEYMTIAYEWQGSGKIPSFVMDLMNFIKSNGMEVSSVWEGREVDYEEYTNRGNVTPELDEE